MILRLYIYIYTCIYMCVYIYIYIYKYACVCIYIYIHDDDYLYIYVCVCVYIYIYISSQHHYKKADKTNIFVVLDRTDYHSKLQNILDGHTKFKKWNKNPTNQLKSKINKLITANNAKLNSTKPPKIIGDYKPGYLFGTVKIHKPNHLLHPIISQIPTPIYELRKTTKQFI